MIQILFAVYSHSLFLYLFFCDLKDTSKWGWARLSRIRNLATEASPRPPPRCCWLVSWPGREASCHALKCRHKTPAPLRYKVCGVTVMSEIREMWASAVHWTAPAPGFSTPTLPSHTRRWPLYLLLGLVIPMQCIAIKYKKLSLMKVSYVHSW